MRDHLLPPVRQWRREEVNEILLAAGDSSTSISGAGAVFLLIVIVLLLGASGKDK